MTPLIQAQQEWVVNTTPHYKDHFHKNGKWAWTDKFRKHGQAIALINWDCEEIQITKMEKLPDAGRGTAIPLVKFLKALADKYGSGGYASGFGTYSGSATTTSSGTYNTQYVPYQYSVYRTSTAFWQKLKPPVFGARFKPIPDDLRIALQRNTGAYVSAVGQDSPAFKANVLDGDLIIQIADKPVTSPQDLSDYYLSHAGQKVTIKLIRNGQTLDFDVQLNERP